MKRMMILLVMALVLFTGSAFAATTNVTVTAVVVGTCTFNTVTDISFGVLPGGDVSQPGTVNINCSNGTPYTVSSSWVAGDALLGATDSIPYTFNLDSATTGTGTGLDSVFNYSVDILGADYAAAAPDIYTDTVTLTILP